MINHPAIKCLTAREQLLVRRDYPLLASSLAEYGLSREDSEAIAYNATYLFHALEDGTKPSSPGDILDMWSLEDIAEFCELAQALQHGDYEYGFSENTPEEAEK